MFPSRPAKQRRIGLAAHTLFFFSSSPWGKKNRQPQTSFSAFCRTGWKHGMASLNLAFIAMVHLAASAGRRRTHRTDSANAATCQSPRREPSRTSHASFPALPGLREPWPLKYAPACSRSSAHCTMVRVPLRVHVLPPYACTSEAPSLRKLGVKLPRYTSRASVPAYHVHR